jgi:hypothetical protein
MPFGPLQWPCSSLVEDAYFVKQRPHDLAARRAPFLSTAAYRLSGVYHKVEVLPHDRAPEQPNPAETSTSRPVIFLVFTVGHVRTF